ncbi:Ig-like domain-containing protein, partial [Pseudomonas sp. FW305-BF6]|uniref:Ig-like domain-containing protein n=1 Tax=Pseudomonas sp. FW305-BF6 TaxID=2070673 RepID=UPI002114B724
VSDLSKTVSGKTIANATVTVKAGEKTVGTGTADAKGAFSIKIATQKAGTTLVITATAGATTTSVSAVVVKKATDTTA